MDDGSTAQAETGQAAPERTNWPAKRLLVGLLLFVVVVMPFSGPCQCGRHPGTMLPVVGGILIIALRVVLAMARREQSRWWFFYVPLAVLLQPIAECIIDLHGSH